MRYVALLRGINIGGNSKIEMKRLKALFKKLDYQDVIIYINSGNVIFETNSKDYKKIEQDIEIGIAKEFSLNIRVVIRTKENIKIVASKIEPTWQNNKDEKTSIMFLWAEVDSLNILKDINQTKADEIIYVDGALIWHTTNKDFNKSGLSELAENKLYKQMTVRNCNTVRKLAELMSKVYSRSAAVNNTPKARHQITTES